MNVSVVIPYCTNDHRFLYANISECLKFSSDIIVMYTDRMYDCVPENMHLLNEARSRFPDVHFLHYSYGEGVGPHYPHNKARYDGMLRVGYYCDYILFLDTDEIPDGDLVKRWINRSRNKDAYYLWGYYYFREPCYRAKTWERTATMFSRYFLDSLPEDVFFKDTERYGIFAEAKDSEIKSLYNEKPMIHHYSWVRTRDQMIRKVKSWGHREDRDWLSLIEKEFSHPFNGTGFVHCYQYEEVPVLFDLK